jgi:hypothetical protein
MRHLNVGTRELIALAELRMPQAPVSFLSIKPTSDGQMPCRTMTNTALIARTRAMVQGWYGKQRNKLRSALLRK